MDWSFIVLLFAASFFLASMTALIIVVYKVFMKPPPANNFANAPPPDRAYQQPPPPQICGWNPPPAQPRNMPSAQRDESGRGIPPTFYDRPVTGLVPFGMTVVSMEAPVFSPEPPVHRAVRVTPASPVPNSIAVPAKNSAWPSQNAQREVIEPEHVQTVIIPESGPGQNFASRPEFVPEPGTEHSQKPVQPSEKAAAVQSKPASEPPPKPTSVLISEAETRPELVFRPEPPQKKTQAAQPSESSPEAAVKIPKQAPAAQQAVPVQSPEPAPDNSQPETSEADIPPGAAPVNLQMKSSRQKKRSRKNPKGKAPAGKKQEGKSKKSGQKDRAQSSPGKTERPKTPESSDSDTVPGAKAEKEQETVRTKALFSRLPGPLQHISLSRLCCILASVCLLSAALFVLLTGTSGEPQDEPLIVDLPQESPEEELPEEELPEEIPPEPEILPDPVSYKMALIGEEEAESPDESGFEESFPAGDYTGAAFYALSFVIQLDSAPGTEFQEIRVLDAATSEDLTAASGSALHVYQGEVPSEDYTAAHPVKSAPVISSAVSDELITCVFVSLEKKEIGDLKVILFREDNALEGGTEIEVNSQLDEIDCNPLYTMGYSLLKLGNQYYVSESGTGIGAIPDENKYVTRKIRCVSLPLTGAAPGLDASSAALFDKTTGERAVLPEGTKVYYKEDYKENQALTSIEFGIRMSGGDYEEAELFLDTVLPGYDLDGQPLMF